MGAIERIVARLRRMDDVRWELEGRTVRVLPSDCHGFEVALTEHRPDAGDDAWTVCFDGWHQHFRSEREALECFAFGLTDACRLICWSRDGRHCRWTVEAKTDDGWIEGSTTGMLLFPLMSLSSVEKRTLQNAFVSME